MDRTSFDIIWFPFNAMRYRCAPPTLVTIYDAFAFTDPARGLIARFREQAPIRRAARRATHISTISQWSAHQFGDNTSRVAGTHHHRTAGTGSVLFPATGDALPPHLPDKRFVLFVAGPEPRKNAALLFEAAAKRYGLRMRRSPWSAR